MKDSSLGRPLRIALVTTFYPPFSFGGDGIYVQRLARALAARGHHVEVVHDTDAYRHLSGKSPEVQDEDDGIIVHRLGSKHPLLSSLGVQQLGQPTTHRKELERLLTDRFDVIHFHNISLIGGPGIWKIGTGIKLHTAHEHWLVCPSHILWRDNRELCDEKRCLRCVLRHGRPPQLWRATDLIAREAHHVDAFLMLSQSAAKNHRRFGFKSPTTVVPSFLPDVPSLPETSSPPERGFFLFVGRLEVIKGLQDVIPAFDESIPADLLIAGDGDYEAELRKLAEGRKNVRFLGRLQENELRELYRDAIAVITPSRCYEVFPLVVLEAFRESTPIIARNLGPYPEIVEETGGGLLFDTAETLHACLKDLSENPDKVKSLGQKAKIGLDRNWKEDVALNAYFDLIYTIRAQKTVSSNL
ncbi:glycosyltransferase [Pseudohalocynthiibacter sp. F2068]|jgi:glycosyltransferase involved in cell wall biosynthesis|uniref:glycosyltransferase n=1 Tax=Pseudohalocynthiibacter sp. F2068 TaxID=2926418 RepID=UPI001FF5861E|nr:glycosyltransferase [Pseudohalocynthiibacter sp. F2068]MCK0104311.1 glycosyltransferase [Pseudohalocynthiibacter sp. F2068]